MNYSIIQKSQLEGAKRLDAEYYQPEFLDVEKKIKKFENYLLKDLITNFTTGKNLKQANCFDNSIKFIRTQNVRPVLIDKEGLSYLDFSEKKYLKLLEGDLLFVRVGEGVGDSSVVTPEFVGSTCSDNVVRVKISKIDPYFTSIFLNSKFGYLYLERVSKGTARPLISSENIDSIRVPFINKEINKYCKNVVLESARLIVQGEGFYQQAENLLLEDLKISEKDFNNQLSCVINLSDAKTANRFDAEYFEPKYRKIAEHIKNNFKWSLLGDLASVKKGFEPGAESYREEGKQFIRVSSLSKYEISDSEQKCLSDELYNKLKADFQPQKGEILLTKDASPGIAYVPKENIEGIISSGILRLKLKNKEIEDEYLALCLNSIIGKMQAQRDAGGSVIMHWKPEEIKNVVIPILPKPIQEKISLLVRQSFKSRKKAKLLLEEAKTKVESLIEKQK